MTTKATRNAQDTTSEGTLFGAFELVKKPGNSASPRAMGKSRAARGDRTGSETRA